MTASKFEAPTMNSRREKVHRSGMKTKNNIRFGYKLGYGKLNFTEYRSTSQTYVEWGKEQWLDIRVGGPQGFKMR